VTTYHLFILDKAIQHHYESKDVICPSQEQVEDALVGVGLELERLTEEIWELKMAMNAIRNIFKGNPAVTEFQMAEMMHEIHRIVLSTLDKTKVNPHDKQKSYTPPPPPPPMKDGTILIREGEKP
jgi:hypothetical protein